MLPSSTTLIKRLPPHRAMQAQTPKQSAGLPIVKPEPPATPALTKQSAVKTPARRTGPHAKLGPHSRKLNTPAQSGAHSTVPVQADAPKTVQDDKISPQQTNPDTDTWAGVQESQIGTDIAQSDSSPVQETQVKAKAPAPVAKESTTLDSAPSAQVQASVPSQSAKQSRQVRLNSLTSTHNH